MEKSSQPEGGHFLKVRQETPRSAVTDCDGVTVTNLLSSNNVPIKIVNDGHSRFGSLSQTNLQLHLQLQCPLDVATLVRAASHCL